MPYKLNNCTFISLNANYNYACKNLLQTSTKMRSMYGRTSHAKFLFEIISLQVIELECLDEKISSNAQ